MTRKKKTLALAATAAATLAAGAAGLASADSPQASTSAAHAEQAAVKATMHSWFRAILASDGDRACTFLTRRARATLEDQFAEGTVDCEDLVPALSFAPAEWSRMRRIKVMHARIRGTNAAVHDTDVRPRPKRPDDQPTRLRKVGGRWLLDVLD